jgi:hypothetical protein
VLCSASGTDVRGLLVAELAKALGQPFYEVDAAGGGEQLRAGLLGRSFAVGQVRHALGALIRACACDGVPPREGGRERRFGISVIQRATYE